jgi:hypothetical protein
MEDRHGRDQVEACGDEWMREHIAEHILDPLATLSACGLKRGRVAVDADHMLRNGTQFTGEHAFAATHIKRAAAQVRCSGENQWVEVEIVVPALERHHRCSCLPTLCFSHVSAKRHGGYKVEYV